MVEQFEGPVQYKPVLVQRVESWRCVAKRRPSVSWSTDAPQLPRAHDRAPNDVGSTGRAITIVAANGGSSTRMSRRNVLAAGSGFKLMCVVASRQYGSHRCTEISVLKSPAKSRDESYHPWARKDDVMMRRPVVIISFAADGGALRWTRLKSAIEDRAKVGHSGCPIRSQCRCRQ